MERYDHGKLAALFHDGSGPRLDDATVEDLYDSIHLPALHVDTARLHQAFLESLSERKSLDYYAYWDSLMDFKTAVGNLALSDLAAVDTALTAQHQRIMARETLAIHHTFGMLVRAQEKASLDEGHPDYMAHRLRSIAFNTGEALVGLGNRFLSTEGQAALFRAVVQQPPKTERLIKDWVYGRKREDDLNALRTRLLTGILEQEVHERAARAYQEPAGSDLMAELRRERIRLDPRNGVPRNRAA